MILVRAVFGLSALLVAMLGWRIAHGAPPPGADMNSVLSGWVRTLKTPDGTLCCSDADCRPTAIRLDDDGKRWAWIGREQYGSAAPDDWREIPERVWDGTQAAGAPPDGRAWVCFYGGEVRCAISGGAG